MAQPTPNHKMLCETPEEWRAIPSAPDHEASNLGRIRGPLGIKKPQLQSKKRKDPYLKFKTGQWHTGTGKNFYVHIAVCEAWHGAKPSDDAEVRHLDGDNQNNKSSNLAWGTRQDNEDDKIGHGTRLYGSTSSNAKLTEEQVLLARRFYAANPHLTTAEVASHFGISQGGLYGALTGKTWAHVGGPVCSTKWRDPSRGKKKLAAADVRAIREQLRRGIFQKDIASAWGVSVSTISHIAMGRIYKWVCDQAKPTPRDAGVEQSPSDHSGG